MRWLMILLMFLFFGAFFIISNQNLHLSDKQDSLEFGQEYYNWASKLFDNGKSIIGHAINSDWIPEDNLIDKNIKNSTNISK
jgi:hypothetical protein